MSTLLIGSAAQGASLILYIGFNGLASLYVISALFGLVQGGIVPCYAIIVRDYFPPKEAGTRVSIAIMATVIGMALGGWMNGLIFDLTGSYQAAFANGVAWNVLNAAIALWLSVAQRRPAGARPDARAHRLSAIFCGHTLWSLRLRLPGERRGGSAALAMTVMPPLQLSS